MRISKFGARIAQRQPFSRAAFGLVKASPTTFSEATGRSYWLLRVAQPFQLFSEHSHYRAFLGVIELPIFFGSAMLTFATS